MRLAPTSDFARTSTASCACAPRWDALQDDVKSIYAEAKSEGFDKTAMGKARR